MSKIEWTDRTWNPVVGCRKVSDGCKNCYAEAMTSRVAMMQEAQGRESPYLRVVAVDRRKWTGRAVFLPERLGEPLRWRKPRRVFVNSMSDLFHEDITFEQIAAVFGVMAATPHLTYQVLTKRPARMLEFIRWVESGSAAAVDSYLSSPSMVEAIAARASHVPPLKEPPPPTPELRMIFDAAAPIVNPTLAPSRFHHLRRLGETHWQPWPLQNVHIGVSVEDQRSADERIPLLLQCPAALRFLSIEPLLGPVDLGLAGGECPACNGEAVPSEAIAEHESACEYVSHDTLDDGGGRCTTCGKGLRPCAVCGPYHGRTAPRGIGWVIVGGESGRGARPCDVSWIRSVVEQCKGAGVPVFVKQLGAMPRGVPSCFGCEGERWDADTCERCGDVVEIDVDGRRVMHLRDRKGADPSEWPNDLRVQEFPVIRNLAAVRGEEVSDG